MALDGTKIAANASKHSALSNGYAGTIEVQQKVEVATLLAKAEAARMRRRGQTGNVDPR